MKRFSMLMAAMLAVLATNASELDEAKANPVKRDKVGAEKLGWELGVQLWTFGAYALPDQLRLAKALDVDYIELGPNVKFSDDEKANLLSLTSDQEQRLKNLLCECGVPPKQLYIHAPANEEQWRKWFGFAKAWNIDALVAEPKPEHYDLIEKLCGEYGIRVGVHNHPSEKNRYWHPDRVLEQIAGRTPLIGFNPDLGHWMRMGVDPVEQLKRPEVGKRVVGVHFNDVKELGVEKSPHVVPGAGAGQTGRMLELLEAHGYKGRFTIEHGNWGKSYGELCDAIRFFDETALLLSGK